MGEAQEGDGRSLNGEIAGVCHGSLHETHFDRGKSKLMQKSMGEFRGISLNNLTPVFGCFRHSSPLFCGELTQLRCPCHAHSQGQESTTLQWMLIACWKQEKAGISQQYARIKQWSAILYMKMMELWDMFERQFQSEISWIHVWLPQKELTNLEETNRFIVSLSRLVAIGRHKKTTRGCRSYRFWKVDNLKL